MKHNQNGVQSTLLPILRRWLLPTLGITTTTLLVFVYNADILIGNTTPSLNVEHIPWRWKVNSSTQPQHLKTVVEDEVSIYQRRAEYTNKVCNKSVGVFKNDPNHMVRAFWYLSEPQMMYCPIAKVGSTFWRRVFEVIRRKDPKLVSPFVLQYIDFNEGKSKFPKKYTQKSNRDAFFKLLNSTVKFVFSREPYHRVFSVFIDKVLSPNAYMWGMGKTAIKRFRSSAKNGSVSCGADVTFAEYVKLMNTQDSKHYDQHLKPVAYTCDPCNVQFDILGKMETFQADTHHILKQLGVDDTRVIFKNMSEETKVDRIVDNVQRMFLTRKSWTKCISFHAGAQRLWRQMQIAGQIDKHFRYPLTEAESNSMSVANCTDMMLAAYRKSSPEVRGQKREAFLQAYSTLSRDDLEALRQKYLIDFQKFNYEQRPADLFGEEKYTSGQFDYFDVMKLR